MIQIATTIEQSKRLLELGIPSETADMVYHFRESWSGDPIKELIARPVVIKENFFGKIKKLTGLFYKPSMTKGRVFDKILKKDIPAWSLSALTTFIPKQFVDYPNLFDLEITFYSLAYINYDCILYKVELDDFFENCVKMIQWLVENGKLNLNYYNFVHNETLIEIDKELREKALRIAVKVHKKQVDKGGAPYIKHILRVEKRCMSWDERIVALLHDTIENGDITAEYLLMSNFPHYIVDAVLSVSRNKNEDYFDFINRCKKNPIGRRVKIADLEDNMDITRLKELTYKDIERLKKYHESYNILKK